MNDFMSGFNSGYKNGQLVEWLLYFFIIFCIPAFFVALNRRRAKITQLQYLLATANLLLGVLFFIQAYQNFNTSKVFYGGTAVAVVPAILIDIAYFLLSTSAKKSSKTAKMKKRKS